MTGLPQTVKQCEGRMKIAWFSPRDVMEILCFTKSHSIISRPHQIPEGAELMNVAYDPSRRAFGAIFYHESWPAVPDGAILPAIEGVGLEIEECNREE